MTHFPQLFRPLFEPADLSDETAPEPLPCDPWVASSTLQKAIRRGDAETAERALVTVVQARGSNVFKRLLVIAYEDIGVGSPAVLVKARRICTDAKHRKRIGGTLSAARRLVRLMAAVPKDRSTDYLISAAVHRSEWEDQRAHVGAMTLAERVATAVDTEQPLATRAIATWYASGLNNGREKRVGPGDLDGLITAFKHNAVRPDLADATAAAARAIREPFALMILPLVQEAANGEGGGDLVESELPPSATVSGVPTYALDKHTRLGRTVIAQFARESRPVCEALERHVPEFRQREAVMLAAFCVDSTPVSTHLDWTRSEELEAIGFDADLQKTGVPAEGRAAILAAVRANLGHLTELREHALRVALGVAAS